MAKAFHVKKKDMTPEELKAHELHIKRSGLIAKAKRIDHEIKELREKELEAADPEYARLKREIRKLEARKNELLLEKRKLEYDALPEKEKRIKNKLGMNPYDNRPIHRSIGSFRRTGSYYIDKENDNE